VKKHHTALRAVRKFRVALVLALGVALIPAGTAHAAAPTPTGMTTMFVTSANGTAPAIMDTKNAVAFFSGKIVRTFDVPGTFLVEVPTQYTQYISGTVLPTFFGCAAAVSDEQRNKFLDQPAFNAATDSYSLQNIARAMGADSYWAQGFKGAGVGVAIIDTGVAPVGPLATSAVAGPDLSFDSQVPALAHNDAFGHGTHLAGIINAVAPEAKIINVKVGDQTGMNDVTQVIAAIDWVREHRNDPGLNIKVLNLSYGLVSANTWQTDELSKSVQAAWDAGIVVVVSAGNNGASSTKADPGVLAPAYDKSILAVAAYDTGVNPVDRKDDSVAEFTSGASSSNKRMPDVAAPGKSIASHHVPGSLVDEMVTGYFCNPADPNYKAIPFPVVDGGRLVRGSGTSQAAAAASGAVALMLQRFPTVTPDVLRLQLRQSAASIPNATRNLSGEGALDIVQAAATSWPTKGNSYDAVTGGAPIAGTRNGDVLFDPAAYDAAYAREYPVQLAKFTAMYPTYPALAQSFANATAMSMATQAASLDGDKDIFGKPFSAQAHSQLLTSGQNTWTMTPEGEAWNGTVMLGTGFASVPGSAYATEWVGFKWRDAGWSGFKWRDESWNGFKWRNGAWADAGYVGFKWRDANWVGFKWRDAGWVGFKWRDAGWASIDWR
jgi:serine protease AprX